ncbi:MAG: urate hydroxylase PuuD [Alphaproteobacteria bacterium]|nr:urate hydroxylase PuuD [Alphaproteobacteria bacterium]
MSAELLDWLNLLLRWLHLIAGIAWIGASFFFMWLDANLQKPPALPHKAQVEGELWMVHSGGFYEVNKILVAPQPMPSPLHWFKWEAYVTWLSGFALLVVVFYFGQAVNLVDPEVADLAPGTAIALGLGALPVGWLAYDRLFKSPLGKSRAGAALGWALLTLASILLCKLFAGRAAFIHVGALVGTCMVANVAMIIIPNQRKLVAARIAGQVPDPALGKQAKQRSVHNNYLTLGVLVTMVAGHFPMLFGHPHNWAVLMAMFAIGALVREFFNRRNAGSVEYRWWGYAAAATLALYFGMAASERPRLKLDPNEAKVPFAEVRAVLAERCATCHSARPTDDTVDKPPGGFVVDTPEQIRRGAQKIFARTVLTTTMPLGNKTEMKPEERELIGKWVLQGAHSD